MKEVITILGLEEIQKNYDAFILDQGWNIADTGAIKDADSDKRISFTDTGDTILYDENENPVLYVDTNERIGILKADPTVELEVVGSISGSGNLQIDGNCRLGSATSDLIGFYDVSGVDQPATVADATGTGDVVARLNEVIARLKELGLIA